jgi:p-cumate 2,3-dioxygenase subunit alpha
VFQLERTRIFEKSWLYLGHESEVPNAGDYCRRTIAGRPMFFVRGNDGLIRAFFNTCTHRGAQVCRQDEGHALSFQCFYHGWTFSTQGDLAGVPDEAGYAECFDKANYALKAPPRVEHYRGFYFVSFDPNIVALESYLGEACRLIDLTMDSAEILGGWTILRGCAKYSINANWKLMVENSYDGYHLPTVHQTYLEYAAWRRTLIGKSPKRFTGATDAFALRYGHGGMLQEAPQRGIANPSLIWSEETNREVERLKAENIARFGEERGREMCEVSRHLVIFPTLAFQDSHSGFRLRNICPVSTTRVDILQWDLVPRNETEELRASRMESSLAFLGPGGLASPDDVEALESCQRGFSAGGVDWSDVSRGMHRKPLMTDELQMRSFWRQWHGLMREVAGEIDTADKASTGELYTRPKVGGRR